MKEKTLPWFKKYKALNLSGLTIKSGSGEVYLNLKHVDSMYSLDDTFLVEWGSKISLDPYTF